MSHAPIKHEELVAALREFADELDSRDPSNRINEYGQGGYCEQLFLDFRLRIRAEVVFAFKDGIPQTLREATR